MPLLAGRNDGLGPTSQGGDDFFFPVGPGDPVPDVDDVGMPLPEGDYKLARGLVTVDENSLDEASDFRLRSAISNPPFDARISIPAGSRGLHEASFDRLVDVPTDRGLMCHVDAGDGTVGDAIAVREWLWVLQKV